MRRLPSLDTLRVFEAAARLGSFKEAADELAVTASAVSHRVQTLEDDLGVPLFTRHTRKVELTPEGERLAQGMRRALMEIRRAVTSVDRREGRQIRLSAIQSHITRWLAPRLHRFRAEHPDIELHISAEPMIVDLTQRTADIALRFGGPPPSDLHVEFLMGDEIVPVASPSFLAEHGPILEPRDILRVPRILDASAEGDASGVNWRSWLSHYGLPLDEVDRGIRFNGAAMTLEAAASGLGVAIPRRSLLDGELRAGRLVEILPEALPTNWNHYAVTLPDLADWPPVRAFIDWLHAEARPALRPKARAPRAGSQALTRT